MLYITYFYLELRYEKDKIRIYFILMAFKPLKKMKN